MRPLICFSKEMCTQGFGGGKLSEKDNLQDLEVDGSTKLKWILNRLGRRGLD